MVAGSCCLKLYTPVMSVECDFVLVKLSSTLPQSTDAELIPAEEKLQLHK